MRCQPGFCIGSDQAILLGYFLDVINGEIGIFGNELIVESVAQHAGDNLGFCFSFALLHALLNALLYALLYALFQAFCIALAFLPF